jgi:hypothetical protein
MRRPVRWFLVVGSVALAAGLLAAIDGPVFMASSATPTFPVTCAISASVSFTPPLVAGGYTFHAKSGTLPSANEIATGTSTLSSCLSSAPYGSPSAGSASFTITLKPVRSAAKNWDPITQSNCDPTTDVNCTYYTFVQADCTQFASATTLTALKHVNVTITWSSEQFSGGTLQTTITGNGAGATSNGGGEVGFALTGKVIAPSDYPYAAAQTTAFIVNNAAGTNLISGCPSGPVSGISIDGATSTLRA